MEEENVDLNLPSELNVVAYIQVYAEIQKLSNTGSNLEPQELLNRSKRGIFACPIWFITKPSLLSRNTDPLWARP